MIGILDLETLNIIKEEKLIAKGYTTEAWERIGSKITQASQEEADRLGKELFNVILSVITDGEISEINKLILDGANLEYRYNGSEKTNRGFTALLYCARKGFYQIFRLLVQAGADINAVSDYRTNAVAWSAREGHLDILEDLILLGVDINLPCQDGDTALHSAARHGKKETVKMLIEAGVILNPVNQKGETPLSIARSKNQTEIADMLADAMISELPPLPVVTSEDLAEELRKAREKFKTL